MVGGDCGKVSADAVGSVRGGEESEEVEKVGFKPEVVGTRGCGCGGAERPVASDSPWAEVGLR